MVDYILPNPFLFLIILSLFLESKAYIKIPLTYYPINEYNDSTPANIINNIILQRVYANIDIGTPRKTINLALLFDTNEFFIADDPENLYEKGLFKDLKFYKKDESNTSKEEDDSGSFQCCGYYFSQCFYRHDKFYFNNQEQIIQFYEAYDLESPILPGAIGMKLQLPGHVCEENLSEESTFFGRLKKINLISSYDWSIFYNSKKYKKEEEGFLLMGSLPHEVDSDLGYYKKESFNETYIKKVNMEPVGNNGIIKIKFDQVFGYYGKNESDLIENFTSIKKENYKLVEFDYHLGGVLGSKDLLEEVNKAFQYYKEKNICFKETFSGLKYEYFYCKKEIADDLKNIKEKFPGVKFQSNDLNYTFTLDADDLFLEEGDFIFCLMYFYSGKINFKMGKPFFKKYQFSFNYEGNYIKFYKEPQNNKSKSPGIPIYVLILAIFGTLLIVGIIVFIFFKFKLYNECIRKKRANELTDDDFEYTSKADSQKDKENHQNDDENDKLGLDIN